MNEANDLRKRDSAACRLLASTPQGAFRTWCVNSAPFDVPIDTTLRRSANDWRERGLHAVPASSPHLEELPMLISLLAGRRFVSLFWCRFFSAFRGNVLKNALVVPIKTPDGRAEGNMVVITAGAVCVGTFSLLSGLGG